MSRKKNALTHGVSAQEVMLWGETYEDYEGLRTRAYEEWFPEGLTEEFELNALIELLWRRRRLERYEKISTQKRLARVRSDNEQSRHIENLKALASEFNAADTVEKVNALLLQLSPLYRNTVQRDWPLRDGDDPAKWGTRIATGLSSWKVPARHEGADEFLEALDPEEMFDRSLGRIERLNAMIDRTIKRLMQIKTMKQMYNQLKPKLVTGVTVQPAAQKPTNDQAGLSDR
jgi:hypothetical protein